MKESKNLLMQILIDLVLFSAGMDSDGSALLQPDYTPSFHVHGSGTYPEADGGGGDVYARQVAVSAYPETIAFLKSAQRCTLF